MIDHDLGAAIQFNLLTRLGLRESDFLLDIGCGSLRTGRVLIPYLLPGRYHGVEPRMGLVDKSIDEKFGREFVQLRRPKFSDTDTFEFGAFEQSFDYILCNSVFTHCSEQMIRDCLIEAEKVLNPDGIFVATFSRGIENYEGKVWIGKETLEEGKPGRILNLTTFTDARIESMCNESGLLLDFLDVAHQTGQTWAMLRKPWRGSLAELTQAPVRKSYIHAPVVPDWPARPTRINLLDY